GSHNAHMAMTGFARGTTTHGAVITRLKGDTGTMPPYVHIGGKLFMSPGVGGGVFGAACQPIMITNPLARQSLPRVQPAAHIPATRFQHGRELLASVDRLRAKADAAAQKMDAFHQRAANILTSTKVRDAFDLSKEREIVRSRYGINMFGQSLLMARRLVEAGPRFVQVKWDDREGAWDIQGVHSTRVGRIGEKLCPRLDPRM